MSEFPSDLTNSTNVAHLIEEMKRAGLDFDAGLTDEEVDAAEKRFEFNFPPDLRNLLQYALLRTTDSQGRPHSPNWRDLDDPFTVAMFKPPVESFLWDMEHNDFWLTSLGPKPKDVEDAQKVMIEALNRAPKLIPLFAHRFLPAIPCEENNPVISFWQPSDTIYYGVNLYDYFETEFLKKPYMSTGIVPKRVPFWSSLVEETA